MALITIVIGIVFVLLLFSLLATTVMELVAGLLSLRGKHLLDAVQDMIGSAKSSFQRHPFYEQLTIGSNMRAGGKALPSYLSAWNFSAILTDILEIQTSEDIGDKIEQVSNARLKKILQFIHRQTGDDLVAFKKKVEEWFNEVMDRASGAYKRKTRTYLFCIGLALALGFNVDVITVYHNLSVNTTLREFVANQATTFVNNNPRPSDTLNPDYYAAKAKIGELVNDNIGAISSPLGLGWEQVNPQQMDSKWWLYHLLGWFTTAMAISLGATFWFDLLRKLVGMRNSGPTPATPAAQAQAPTTPAVPKNDLRVAPSDSILESTRDAKAPPRRSAPRPSIKAKKKPSGDQ
jgi:hypothetical protein